MPTKSPRPAAAKAKARKKANGEPISAGRPPRISRQAILEKSIALLEDYPNPMEGFTLTRIAEELGTVSMALYNYFPGREALLSAVADHICMQFRMPKEKPGQTWQQTLHIWLKTFKKHAERYPVIFKVMGIDGQMSAGWLRISITVSKTLYEQGLRGRDLALMSWLFCSQAISLIMYELGPNPFRSPVSLSHIDELEPDEQDFFLMLRPHHIEISSGDVLDEGFQQLIAMLDRKLATVTKS